MPNDRNVVSDTNGSILDTLSQAAVPQADPEQSLPTRLMNKAISWWMSQPSWAQQAAQLDQGEGTQAMFSSPEDLDRRINFAMGMVGPTGLGIRAYHGSPHDFMQFDTSKIGTGEGAQSYGHGLYFAEEPKVAGQYRRALSGDQFTIGGKPYNIYDPVHIAAYHIDQLGNRKAAIEYLNKYEFDNEFSRQAVEILNSDRPLPEVKYGGHTYEVDIKADPEHFLDWDQPITKQSKKVHGALDKILGGKGDWSESPDYTGGNLIRLFPYSQRMQIAQELKEAGIPGIRYLDQNSRHAAQTAEDYKLTIKEEEKILEGMRKASPGYAKKVGETQAKEELKRQEDLVARFKSELEALPKPTYNYVVFDDKTIDIIKKYGFAGLIAGGAAGLAQGDKAQAGEVDYDYEGAKAAGVKPDPKTGHMPDTYKLPNHITFSDESAYNDGGAGHWEKINNTWNFMPGPTNLQHHSMEEIRAYFKQHEPDSILVEPK